MRNSQNTNYTQESKVHSFISPGGKSIASFDMAPYQKQGNSADVLDSLSSDLQKIGVDLPSNKLMDMVNTRSGGTMDALQPLNSQASIITPVQFLQNFLPGFVFNMTGARKIDDFIGILIAGRWEDEEVVQGFIEQTGTPQLYGDYTNVPLSRFNNNWNKSTIVRFELGFQIGQLEQRRASAANIDATSQSRLGSLQALEINRNTVGFFGFNAGANNTFGYLNAQGLPAYQPAPTGDWDTATYLEIVNDLLFSFALLQTQTLDNVDPRDIATSLTLPTNRVNYLSRSTDFGYSVRKWLAENYPKCTVKSAPQQQAANGAENVYYLYPDVIADPSTDGGRTFIQMIPTKLMNLGVEQRVKGFIEDYSNATAGVMCKRPWAVVRMTGI